MRLTVIIPLLIPTVVLSQAILSQLPSTAYVDNEVKMVCVVTAGTAPSFVDWNVDSLTFTVQLSDCTYIGTVQLYTPGGCVTEVNKHTMEMTIPSTNTSESGKQWTCTASGSTSNTVTADIRPGGTKDDNLSTEAIVGIALGSTAVGVCVIGGVILVGKKISKGLRVLP